MSASGWIAGSLGVTVVLGGLALLGVGGATFLILRAPPPPDAASLEEAVRDQSDDLAWCARGGRGGTLNATVVVKDGNPTHIQVREVGVDNEVAQCVADVLVSTRWPSVRGAVTVPLDLR